MMGKWWIAMDSANVCLRPPEQATSKGEEQLQMNLTSSMACHGLELAYRGQRTRDSSAIDEVVIEQCPHQSARGDFEMSSFGQGGLSRSEQPEGQKGMRCPTVEMSLLSGVKAWIKRGIEGTSRGRVALCSE